MKRAAADSQSSNLGCPTDCGGGDDQPRSLRAPRGCGDCLIGAADVPDEPSIGAIFRSRMAARPIASSLAFCSAAVGPLRSSVGSVIGTAVLSVGPLGLVLVLVLVLEPVPLVVALSLGMLLELRPVSAGAVPLGELEFEGRPIEFGMPSLVPE